MCFQNNVREKTLNSKKCDIGLPQFQVLHNAVNEMGK